jgi:flagellar protein FliT
MINMNVSDLLDRYEAMWRLTQNMLTAAKQGDWDQLVGIEQTRAAIVEELKSKDKIAWQATEATKKETLIRAMMAADAEIKTLTESWMAKLQGNLGSMDAEKKLKKAYGAL